MLAEFLKEFIGSVAAKEFLIDERRKLFSQPVFNPPLPDEPGYPTIVVRSLAGFCDALDETDQVEVIVCTSSEVSALSAERGKNRKRDVFLKAVCTMPLKIWNYQSLEDFRIRLVTSFLPTPARASLLERIATVKDEAIMTSEDDGITQKVSAKTGIATVAQVGLPPVIELRQMRSFEEVEQVETPYLFRLRKGSAGIEAALFEVETDWQTKQARIVAEYVKEKLGDDVVVVY